MQDLFSIVKGGADGEKGSRIPNDEELFSFCKEGGSQRGRWILTQFFSHADFGKNEHNNMTQFFKKKGKNRVKYMQLLFSLDFSESD